MSIRASGIGDAKLRNLLERIITTLRPETVYLFGSRARGSADEGSDYDLFVIVPNDAPTETIRLTSTQTLSTGTGIPADIIACRRRWFDRNRDQMGTLSYKIAREGVLVYGK